MDSILIKRRMDKGSKCFCQMHWLYFMKAIGRIICSVEKEECNMGIYIFIQGTLKREENMEKESLFMRILNIQEILSLIFLKGNLKLKI